jgi:hypothetical protein
VPDAAGMRPTFGATVNRGVLTIVSWRSSLLGRGDSAAVTGQRGRAGVSFADLTVVGEQPGVRELIVDFLEPRMASEQAESCSSRGPVTRGTGGCGSAASYTTSRASPSRQARSA